MNLRDQLLQAAKRAGEVLEETAAKRRILEDGYTRIDPIAIAESDGVPVMVRPLEKLLGAFLKEEESPGILVNSQRPIGMVHMTCAHELGHFFLGHGTKTDEDLDYGNKAAPEELAANEFAYKLLMPKWLVAHMMRRKGWGRGHLQQAGVVYQLSLRLGVSYMAMVWSLNRLALLDMNAAQAMSRISPKSLKEAFPSGLEVPRGGDVWLLDPRDQDFVIEPRVSDRFVIELPNHVGAGYVWTAEEASAVGFTIRPVLIDATTAASPSTPVMVGGTPNSAYLIEPSPEAVNTDAVLPVQLAERQPWISGEPRDKFVLRAQYETLPEGLSRGTRRRIVEGIV